LSNEKYGFHHGRWIHNTIGVAQEGFHLLKSKKQPYMVLTLDKLSKAYDREKLIYLGLILIHIGFCINRVNWIMGSLTSISFAMLICGSTSIFFNPTRGLR